MNPSASPDALAAALERLRALEAENARLQAERDRLLAHAAALKDQSAKLQSLNDGMQVQLREALEEVAELRRQLYGEKSEHLSAEQEAELAELAGDLQEQARREPPASDGVLEDEDDVESENKDRKDAVAPRRRSRPGRHPLPEHLDRRTTILEPEGLAPCSHCGRMPGRIGEEVSEELDYVRARLVVNQTVRPKYACGCGCGGVSLAPLPPRILPQSKLGTGLAVHLLLARFDDHVAYYTLERTFLERHGVVVPRQQMVQWTGHVALLSQALVHRMFERMKQRGYLQIDETPVKVMDPEVKGKCARGYLWFYAVPGGDVYLDFQDTRGRKAPHARLEGFTGTIQTDAYEVYDSLKKVMPGLKRIGCAAHARRKFHRAVKDKDRRAIAFMGLFRQLYALERQSRDWESARRRERRQQEARPVWERLKQAAEALQPRLLPQSSLGKAVSYLLNEYTALTGYLDDGDHLIDNNLVENSIRIPAVGRRRWLFIGHPDAGWRSAVIYSLIVSCRRRGINPQEYLTDILNRLPGLTINQLDPLLPENWKPPSVPPPASS